MYVSIFPKLLFRGLSTYLKQILDESSTLDEDDIKVVKVECNYGAKVCVCWLQLAGILRSLKIVLAEGWKPTGYDLVLLQSYS